MKANEIPEKIYLQVCGDCKDNDCKNCKFEDLEEITWCKDKIFEKDIEYTRTDAFIEKACEWLLNNTNYYIINDKTKFGVDWLKVKAELFDDFKKAMMDAR